MKIKGISALCCALVVLGACVATEPESVSDVHTQTAAGVSKEYVGARKFGEVIHVQAYTGTQLGSSIYGLNIRRNAGASAWARYNSAYSFGQALTYRPMGSAVGACAPFGCDIVEHGQVVLNAEQFQSGLANGLELRLVGTGDSTVIDVPAEAFQQAAQSVPR